MCAVAQVATNVTPPIGRPLLLMQKGLQLVFCWQMRPWHTLSALLWGACGLELLVHEARHEALSY